MKPKYHVEVLFTRSGFDGEPSWHQHTRTPRGPKATMRLFKKLVEADVQYGVPFEEAFASYRIRKV